MTTTTLQKTLVISGFPGGLFYSPGSHTFNAKENVEDMIRTSLVGKLLGYWVGGCGYDLTIRPDHIGEIEACEPGQMDVVVKGNFTTIKSGSHNQAYASLTTPVGVRRIKFDVAIQTQI